VGLGTGSGEVASDIGPGVDESAGFISIELLSAA